MTRVKTRKSVKAKLSSKIRSASKVKSPPEIKTPTKVAANAKWNADLPGLSPVVRPWPKGYRSACLFTFDLDAEVTWVFRQADDPIGLSMGRYEPRVGVPLLLNMLDEFAIKSTFFVPGWVAEKYVPMLETILRRGHDVEHHGYLHEPPRTFKSEEEEEAALVKGIETLERLTGRRPRAYRSPFWEFSPNTIPLLERHGFEYTGDLMDTLLPDYHVVNGRTTSMINLPGHWILDDLAHFYYHISARKTILSCKQVLDLYKEELHGIRAYGGLFTLTMHPQASGRPSRVLMIREFIRHVLSLKDVWVTSPAELVKYWRTAHPVEEPPLA
jgi:peptidoglycan/xylan/chitin deacetylase (PgdA/CDA1 family)